MKAMTRKRFGGPEVLQVVDLPAPSVSPGTVMIEVRAFGLNRAELYMRRGEWGEVAAVSGIECVGRVLDDATGRLPAGQAVMALMGGMGRSINGSYADVTVVPASNVIPIDSSLPWEVLAALPETYATAWACLHQNLRLRAGQRLVVRGGTSSLGQAAIDLARHLGAEVIATTRSAAHAALLRELGARHVVVGEGELAGALAGTGGRADAVLDLLGNSSIVDSLRATRPGGRTCLAGFLAGLAPLADFNPLSQMPCGVHLSFFGSFNFGSADFPLTAIPMQGIVDLLAAGQLRARPPRTFAFSDIGRAHQLMEQNAALGKLVVLR